MNMSMLTGGSGSAWVPGRPLPSAQVGATTLSVGQRLEVRDVASAVTLSVHRGTDVRGNVQFVGDRAKPTDSELASSMLSLVPVGGVRAVVRPSRIEADGSFFLGGIPPGGYVLQSLFAFGGWSVRDVVFDGQNRKNRRINVDPHSGTMNIILSDKPSPVLMGTVRDSDGSIVPFGTVYVFPSAHESWSEFFGTGLASDFREARADATGRFRTTVPANVPLLLTASAGRPAWTTLASLSALARGAEPLLLASGEQKTVDVTRRPN
jgi:hypothetical protein